MTADPGAMKSSRVMMIAPVFSSSSYMYCSFVSLDVGRKCNNEAKARSIFRIAHDLLTFAIWPQAGER